ncbi:DUF1616 domain-containing protein [Candidatus Methanomassiliicoccus intestinalis]|uniref:DUF1616 domain-containing protein n=1 Tax=Candidatus Methanomassiliicoccus intestinalis TaxID=1406512 RepID=UPI0037DD2065
MKNFVFAGPSRPFDLILNLVIVVVALFMSLAGLYGVVLDIIAFYAVFFSVGYALVSALFPGNTALMSQSFTLPRTEKTHEITMLERIALSVALSAVIVGITGTFLSRGIFGITTITATFEILIFTVIFTIIAISRRISWARDPFILNVKVGTGIKYTTAEKSMLMMVVAALVLFAAVSAVTLAKEPQKENFAEFSISGPSGTVDTLPTTVTGVSNVVVNIKSHLSEAENLTLIVSDGLGYTHTVYFTLGSVISLDASTGQSTVLSLDEGEELHLDIYFSVPSPGSHTIFFTLISSEQTLQLWMPVYVPTSE